MINAKKTAERIGTPSMLVGLTEDEAVELQRLSRAVPCADAAAAQRRDTRWIELYLKHELAKIEVALPRKRR